MIDLDFNRDGTPRTKKDLQVLLDCVKRNDADLPKEEQDRLIDEISYKINGYRHSKDEILQDIKDGQSDLNDFN